MQATHTAVAAEPVPGIRPGYLWWPILSLALLVAAIQSEDLWFLNFIHVFYGVLWTGTDLFMGFVVGPVMRRMPLPARQALTMRLVPRMLFYMPTLAIVTGTAGWFLAAQMGYLDIGYPEYWWVVAALVIVAILTVQGLGMLLPINLTVYLELRKPQPDGARIGRLMRVYLLLIASQGLMQLLILVVMARFATGL